MTKANLNHLDHDCPDVVLGSGLTGDIDQVTCQSCIDRHPRLQRVDCPMCEGFCEIELPSSNPEHGNAVRCPFCRGSGEVPQDKALAYQGYEEELQAADDEIRGREDFAADLKLMGSLRK